MNTPLYNKSYVMNIIEQLVTDLKNRGIPFKCSIYENDFGGKYHDEGTVKEGSNHKIDIHIGESENQLDDETVIKIIEGEIEDVEEQFSEKQIMGIISTIFHEYRHLEQTEKYKYNPDFSNKSKVMSIMNAIQKSGLEHYYFENYRNDLKELDATKYGIEESIKFVKKYFPEIDAEKSMLQSIQDCIKEDKDDKYGFQMFDENKSSTIEEILSQLQERIENPKRVNLDKVVSRNIIDEEIKNIFTDELVKKYNKCNNAIEQDTMILLELVKLHPEILQEYPILLNDIELQSQISSMKQSNITKESVKNTKKENKKMEQPLRSFLSQTNPEIEISPNFINHAQFQLTSDGKTQIEKRKNPLVSDNKVIGEMEETEVYDFETGTSKITRFETVESENKIYTIDSEIQTIGKDYSVTATMDILNEISKSKEKATYIRDINGNETYTYMKNGTKEQIIKKTERGTTIDIYKDGQPYETYEYDENGKALVPMGMMEQLPEDYIESCFRMPLPEYEQIQYQEPEQEQEPKNVSTQKLGKETLDMQQDTKTLDDVEKQMEEQEMEINEFGEIIRKGKTNSRFDLGGTMDEAINQTLNEFIQKLDNDDLDDNSKKKKDDEFKVEKGDDDYVR